MKRRFLLVLVLVVVGVGYLLKSRSADISSVELFFPKRNYKPKIVPASEHTILLVGDSMTDVLRPYDSDFRAQLAKYYPEKTFGIFNYGYGATNIESLPERLGEETQYLGVSYPAILEREFDFIFIESFGYNPLSHLPLKDGLKKQEEILKTSVERIIDSHPNSVIIFVTTIAPNDENFGKGLVDLTPEQRQVWVSERRAYIKNHAKFALSTNIYLLDIYEKSSDTTGNGMLKYIDAKTNLHPSVDGVKLINKSMADFLHENNLIP